MKEENKDFNIFDLNTPFRVFKNNFDNESIGKISVKSDALCCLRYNLEAARKIIKAVCWTNDNYLSKRKRLINGDIKEVHEYEPLIPEITTNMPKINMSPEIMHNIYNNIKETNLTDEDIIKFLYDENSIDRMLQETTIDAVKTGILHKSEIDLMGIQQLSRKLVPKIIINWGEHEMIKRYNYALGIYIKKKGKDNDFYKLNELKNTEHLVMKQCSDKCQHFLNCTSCQKSLYEQRELGNFVPNEDLICHSQINRYIFKDMFSDTKIHAYNYMAKKLEKHVKNYDRVEFTKEGMSMFGEYDLLINSDLKHSLTKLKSFYTSLTNMDIESVAGVQHNEFLLKEKHNDSLLSIGSTFRALTPNMSLEQRGELAQFIGQDTSFAMSILPEEYIAMGIYNFGVIDFAGEKIDINKKYKKEHGKTVPAFRDGDTVYLTFGQYKDSEKELIVFKDLNGLFTVKKFKNKYYVTKKIVEQFTNLNSREVIVKLNFITKDDLENAIKKISKVKELTIFSNPKDGDILKINNKSVIKLDCPKGNTNYSKLIDNKIGVIKDIISGEVKNRNNKVKYNAFIIFSELNNNAPKKELLFDNSLLDFEFE